MTPVAAVALAAAGIGLAIAGAIHLIRWADRRMENLLHDAFNYSLDTEYQELLEAEDA